MMNALRRATCVVLLFPMPGIAAEIYGTISASGKPLAGESVSLACGKETPAPRPTDAFGSYRIFVRTQGPCRLTVRGLEVEVRSYAGPARYDFEMRSQGGKTFLQRR
jgi:hypothetical protein